MPLVKNASGQLVEVSEEEANRQLGRRQNKPISPLETAAVGQGPDSAKMAGTPEQKTSALRAAMQSYSQTNPTSKKASNQAPKTLAQFQLDSQVPKPAQLTKQQTQSLNQAPQSQALMQNLGQLNQQAANLAIQGAATTKLNFVPNTGNKALDPVLSDFSKNPSADNVRKINATLGRTAENQLSAQEIIDLYKIPEVQVTPQTVTAGQVLTPEQLTGMGFKDINEVADILGVNSNELTKMPAEQMFELISNQQFKYQDIDNLNSMLADPSIPPEQKADIRNQLAAYEQTALTDVTKQTQEIGSQIEQNPTFTVGDNEYSMQDILSSKALNEEIFQYLAGQNPELKQTSPELARWADTNKAALETAKQKMQSAVQTVEEVIRENQNLIPPGIDKALYDKLAPGWNTNIRAKPSKILGTLAKFKPEQQTNIIRAINDNPKYIDFIKDLDANQIAKLGFDDVNSKLYKNTIRELRDMEAIANLSKKPKENEIAQVFGYNKLDDLLNDIDYIKAARQSGRFDNSDFSQLDRFLSVIGDDNKLDKQDLIKYSKKNDLDNLLTNGPGKQLPNKTNLKDLLSEIKQDETYKVITSKLYKDGPVTEEKLDKLNKMKTNNLRMDLLKDNKINNDDKVIVDWFVNKEIEPGGTLFKLLERVPKTGDVRADIKAKQTILTNLIETGAADLITQRAAEKQLKTLSGLLQSMVIEEEFKKQNQLISQIGQVPTEVLNAESDLLSDELSKMSSEERLDINLDDYAISQG